MQNMSVSHVVDSHLVSTTYNLHSVADRVHRHLSHHHNIQFLINKSRVLVDNVKETFFVSAKFTGNPVSCLCGVIPRPEQA